MNNAWFIKTSPAGQSGRNRTYQPRYSRKLDENFFPCAVPMKPIGFLGEIRLLIPQPAERDVDHRVFLDAFVLGTIYAEPRRAYKEIAARMADDDAQGVILGRSEIDSLILQAEPPLPLFDINIHHAQLQLDPSVKVVVASGYATKNIGKNAFASGAKGFIGKPYQLTKLEATVREVLAGQFQHPGAKEFPGGNRLEFFGDETNGPA